MNMLEAGELLAVMVAVGGLLQIGAVSTSIKLYYPVLPPLFSCLLGGMVPTAASSKEDGGMETDSFCSNNVFNYGALLTPTECLAFQLHLPVFLRGHTVAHPRALVEFMAPMQDSPEADGAVAACRKHRMTGSRVHRWRTGCDRACGAGPRLCAAGGELPIPVNSFVWEIFRWSCCTTPWVPPSVVWGPHVLSVPHAAVFTVLLGCLLKTPTIHDRAFLLPDIFQLGWSAVHAEHLIVFYCPTYTYFHKHGWCSGPRRATTMLQPLVLTSSPTVRQFLLWRWFDVSASTWVFSLSFFFLWQPHQNHLSIVGMFLPRRLHRPTLHRRNARSVHLGARVFDAPCEYPSPAESFSTTL